MTPTYDQLAQIVGGKPDPSNTTSVIVALQRFGKAAGLDKPHRSAHYLAQLAEESGGFKYDAEIASGAAYEGRKDLGNTEPGDGKKFKGRTPGQITGRANYTAFRDWCIKKGYNPPDFVAKPELLNTDPWEGLGPIWFWTTHNLNTLADENNIEQITKKINGGLNGYPDRIRYYIRAALVLLGFAAADIKGGQKVAQDKGFLPKDEPGEPTQIDGDAGPKTRAALHMMLAALSVAQVTPITPVAPASPPVVVTPSPVVTETEVPVVPKGADKPGLGRWFGGFSLASIPAFFANIPIEWKIAFGVAVGLGIVALLFRGEQIAARAKSVIKSFES